MTSGNYGLTPTRDEFLTGALRIVGAIDAGDTNIDSELISQAASKLNALLKHWQSCGIEIWTTGEAIVFPQLGQVRYTLSSTSTDNSANSYVETTLAADVSSGSLTITVDSITGIATTNYIGVQLDDGTLQWTTINGAPSGSTITLAVALTDSASEGNLVLVYQTKLVRPLKILSARRYNLISGIDTPLSEFDRIEYQEMPNKTASGAVNSFYYDRRGGANNSGLFYLWTGPDTTEEIIKLTVARQIQIFSAAGDLADLPEEWTLTVQWNLANELADEYDVPEPKRSRIEKRAAELLAQSTWNETELTDITFVPDMRR